MANEGDDTSAVFNLDVKEALEKILKMKEGVEGLGDAKNVEGLIAGLGKVGFAVGIVGATIFALKTTMEKVFEAEELKQVNKQFEIMSAHAGVLGEELKKSMVAASNGFATEAELMRATNKALVELNTGAEKFPKLMEIARKSTAIFGGDAVSNFEAMTHAIASGNLRGLKNLGITVDADKAYRDYAKTLGVTAGELNQAGKQQALMNAVLEKGQKEFKNVDGSIKEATNTWKQLIVTIKEIHEVSVMAFEKTMGPMVRTVLKGFRDFAGEVRELMVAKYGDGMEQAAAKTNLLEKEYSDLMIKVGEFNKTGQAFVEGHWIAKGFGDGDAVMARTQKRMNDIIEELKKTGAATKAHAEEQKKILGEAGGGEGANPEGQVDKRKLLENEARFQKDILKLKEDRIREEMRLTKSLTEFDALQEQSKNLLRQESQAKSKEIANSEELNERQKAQMIEALHQSTNDKIAAMDLEAAARRRQYYQEQIGMTDSLEQYETMKEQEKAALLQQHELERQMIEQNKLLSDQQRKQALLESEQMYQMQLNQMIAQGEAEREQIIDRWGKSGTNAAEQFARGFAQGSLKAQQSLRNFQAQGAMVFNAFTTQAGNAFMQLGEGGKKGSEILRGAVLGMIADIAQNYGQMLLATGVWPPNPLALGAGAALLTLAGYLRSQANGKAQSSGGMGGGGSVSGMGDIGGVPSSLAQSNLASDNQKQAKAFHFEIHGNVLDSDATRTKIAEWVRDAADATDFSIRRVGGAV